MPNISNEKIHGGFIKDEFKDSFKDSDLNNFDLGTTRVFRGYRPMWKQLGFLDDSYNVPNEPIYWKNVIPKEFNYSNLSGIEKNEVIGEENIGVQYGTKTPRKSYVEIIINEEEKQEWDGNYLYPILPRINKFGVFANEVNVLTSYGVGDSAAFNPKFTDENSNEPLMADVDLNHKKTNDIIDKTGYTRIDYYKDFELFLDKNLRLSLKGKIKPDNLETKKSEQAF